ncbi:hypothetical protein PV327_000362 [Microctonus hyperodae]|uniref:HTH psq-type domain-containing protein n=1 Tax=Microctonus hyperodae TaxID=165561 RepID=A0AA39L288_MICHY|nr:hypothetical protein PV327_000362 [Microctonus hyperodae]
MRSESARPGKRPMRALSAGEKMEAIQRVHEGESKASVARDIGVPESTLRGWCKSEHKIRGMARNSSTPDSEAHSPESTSGANHLALASGGANHSSEDESSAAKRAKIDQHHQHHTVIPGSSFCTNENSENEASRLSDASKIDYVSLMASMASMRPEHSSLIMQQLGLQLGAAAATNSFAKSLLSMSTAMPHSSTVGLVENGLQYTRSGNNNSNNSKRHSTSAIAPAQMDSVAKSCSRKSLPPAAEAPFSPLPASPRKTSDMYLHHHHHQQQQQQAHQQQQQQQQQQQHQQQQFHHHHHHQQRDAHSNNKVKERGLNKKCDEQLWTWLTQQQALLGQQSALFNPSNQNDGSWFWQWYKQCSSPLATSTHQPIAKKSPSKARALLDSVLCNNNNENVRRSFNDVGTLDVDGNQIVDSTQVISPEEAIEHGDKFLKWLDKCSDPAVTRLQVLQLKYLLDNLRSGRNNKPTSMIKHSRK